MLFLRLQKMKSPSENRQHHHHQRLFFHRRRRQQLQDNLQN
jgi:hypothetical protein